MTIKSNRISYDTFIYDNNNLEKVTSYKYLGIDIHHKLNWNYSIKKKIIGDEKLIMGLKTIVIQSIFGFELRRNSYLRLSLHLLFFMDVKCMVVVSLVNHG